MRAYFIGLGAMGHPMAARLAQSGVAVAGIDADPGRTASWRRAAGGAAHALEEADIVLVCVTDATASERAIAESVSRMRRGALCIDHTTTDAALARTLADACRNVGVRFVDAPVSGGVEGARAGTLVAMAGGDAADVAAARRAMCAYASRIVHLGPAGSGQLAKLANQLAIAGTVRGLAEAVALARAAGLPVPALLEALGHGTARSAQLDRLQGTLAEDTFDFRAAFEWLVKDLELAAQDARGLGVDLPMAALVRRLLEKR